MGGSSSRKQSYITVSQFALIIFGSIVGVGIFSLPNGVVEVAHQDGWISTLLGGLYPLYVVIIASYIGKRFPDDNILMLSKKYFGTLIGSVFNFIFATYFIFIASMIASYYSNLMRSYINGFLTPFKMIAIFFICVIYAASKDLRVIGRISEICFYITIFAILVPIVNLREMNLTNIYPIFGSGFRLIAKGSIKSIFAYSGAEIILLIYPFLKEKNKMLTSSLISVALVIVIYVWCVFITTYYVGPDIISKGFWTFLSIMSSIGISAINNYRYIFLYLWSIIALKSVSINGYATIFIIKELARKIQAKYVYILVYILLVYLAFQYGNEISRQSISDNVIPWYIIFNLLYMTVIAAFVFFKGGAKA